MIITKLETYGLNPCFNGTYSRSHEETVYIQITGVLILVLMEHTLGAESVENSVQVECLNPCFNGTYSRRGNLL